MADSFWNVLERGEPSFDSKHGQAAQQAVQVCVGGSVCMNCVHTFSFSLQSFCLESCWLDTFRNACLHLMFLLVAPLPWARRRDGARSVNW